jgi:hypothetical protein
MGDGAAAWTFIAVLFWLSKGLMYGAVAIALVAVIVCLGAALVKMRSVLKAKSQSKSHNAD